MKQIKLKLFLFLIISMSGSSAFAVPTILFNLDSQHFSTAIAGGMTVGRYDLPQSYASTNLNFTNGYYTTTNDNGYFKVEAKTPISNWNITVDAWYVLSNYNNYNQTRSIVLTSENGESIIISLKYNEIMFNGVSVYQPNSYQRLVIKLTQTGSNVDISINGTTSLGTANLPTFGNLKFVDVQLIEERTSGGAGNNYHQDRLNSLIIGSQ